jgi:hypothetical protein
MLLTDKAKPGADHFMMIFFMTFFDFPPFKFDKTHLVSPNVAKALPAVCK